MIRNQPNISPAVHPITTLIDPTALEQLPFVPRYTAGCSLCEEQVPRETEIVCPTRYSTAAHQTCYSSIDGLVSQTFRDLIHQRNMQYDPKITTISNTVSFAGHVAVRVACGMPITEYLTKNGAAALKKIYEEVGVPAARAQLELMSQKA